MGSGHIWTPVTSPAFAHLSPGLVTSPGALSFLTGRARGNLSCCLWGSFHDPVREACAPQAHSEGVASLC